MLSEKVLGLRQEQKKEYQINFDSVEFCWAHTVAMLVGADLVSTYSTNLYVGKCWMYRDEFQSSS